ncbi:MAG: YIP1 family protein [Chloroflexota bacterium]
MTESLDLKPSRRLNFARVMEVLLQPARTLKLIVEESRSSWLTPMLALSLSSLMGVVVSGYLTARAASMGEMQLPRDWEWWTPDMQNNYMQAQQSMQGPVFTYVIPLLSALASLWLGWLLLSGLLHLGSTLLGGRGSMQNALNVAAWASLPFLVRDLLRVVYMLLAGHAIVSPGLSGFAGSSQFLTEILSRVDIFFIWTCILLIIGFAVADSLPRKKAIADVAVVIVLLMLAQAGIGTLLAGASGMAVQRPFF